MKGSYVILLRLTAEAEIEIGRLGRFHFAPGYYAYCGSALGGLEARIARHRRHEKKLHWHIDYFREHADWVGVWAIAGDRSQECALASLLQSSGLATAPVAGFGSSDCHCRTHLLEVASTSRGETASEAVVQAIGEIFSRHGLPFVYKV